MGVGYCHALATLAQLVTGYPLYRRLGGSQVRFVQVQENSLLVVIRNLVSPTRSESLYDAHLAH